MKKFIVLFLAMVLCTSLMSPALAADEFVPSITYKANPEVVHVKDDQGNDVLGVVCDAKGNVIGYIGDECLVLTSVANAKDGTGLSEEAKALLEELYEKLSNGTMTLPFAEGIDPSQMVIRDLFDVSWTCSDHPDMIEPEGVTVTFVFDLGVDADTEVFVMTYKNEKWAEVVSVTNNGDGTVTCVFENFCPVAIAVPVAGYDVPDPIQKESSWVLWVVAAMIIVGIASGAVLFLYKRKDIRK